jgi:hypothetical protein
MGQTEGVMESDAFFLFVRLVFAGLFLATVIAGIYLWKNYERLFGLDPNMPSENDSARAYSKVQVFSVWAHVFLLTGAFTFLIH